MPTLEITNFNIVCSVLGGFITLFGLVSYLCKERFYLSEALISTLAGVVFSPHAANFIKPMDYAMDSQRNLDAITLYFTRLVLGVQLVIAGVQLPGRYLQTEWKSLALLLGPGMAVMWLSSGLLIWGLVPNISFVEALAVGACVTPTDPVLSNSIVKGKFADKNIPRPLQRIIIAESGANDGLGYPFLFLALYLLKYTQGPGFSGGGGKAIALWVYETLVYEILLSVVYGAVVGWLSMKLLHWAEEKRYVDRESFLVFAISLGLFIMGTCGLIGTDDLLACFIAGNAFTHDDWFRLETMDDSLQPTIDMLLNLAIFVWFGAVCPWVLFAHNDIIPIYRLIVLGILILLFRRLPVVFAMHKYIHQIEQISQALFVGFFGPIGVGAIFYLSVCRNFLLEDMMVDGVVRSDAARTAEVTYIVVWFLVICSIFVHGLSIPLGKAGYHIPRTISTALSSNSGEQEPIRLPSNLNTHSTATPTSHRGLRFYRNRSSAPSTREPPRVVFQISAPQQRREEQQEEEQGQQQREDSAVASAANASADETLSPQKSMPAVPAPLTVHERHDEPRRPIKLMGDDGRVTQTLNDSE
ncbi:Na/H antiporter, putative [Talaromyces stipitatus ATCC 10500]|uniref:Na/H antiporter, putative n=1 Tax=Talaromyces stipitatus (strain ATCC 10500 / CBS 375.48 / QM 6759 / NRRL 1006) TaxID=441959 RepID=B8ML90_TALSN|nr:Na/H antiporter, putative [Talaromyces stipitatus ATCC 10500]EED15005.1 Na/H antiporter, putative [Talaromyces stipitatus ATCC 10500]